MTSKPPVSRTRATLRIAEFGFGVVVHTGADAALLRREAPSAGTLLVVCEPRAHLLNELVGRRHSVLQYGPLPTSFRHPGQLRRPSAVGGPLTLLGSRGRSQGRREPRILGSRVRPVRSTLAPARRFPAIDDLPVPGPLSHPLYGARRSHPLPNRTGILAGQPGPAASRAAGWPRELRLARGDRVVDRMGRRSRRRARLCRPSSSRRERRELLAGRFCGARMGAQELGRARSRDASLHLSRRRLTCGAGVVAGLGGELDVPISVGSRTPLPGCSAADRELRRHGHRRLSASGVVVGDAPRQRATPRARGERHRHSFGGVWFASAWLISWPSTRELARRSGSSFGVRGLHRRRHRPPATCTSVRLSRGRRSTATLHPQLGRVGPFRDRLRDQSLRDLVDAGA